MRLIEAGSVRSVALAAGMGLLLVAAGRGEKEEATAKIGLKIADFTLQDASGKPWALAEAKDEKAVVVLFIGTECPLNNAYMPRLAELHQEFSARGVAFVAVNANQQDSREKIAKHTAEHHLPFPVLRDEENRVTDLFGAVRTPEAFLLDTERVVRYRGRIDDQFGIGFKRPKPTRRDLAEAIEEVLAGKAVSQPVTEAPGCLISRSAKAKPSAGTVTYTKHVAPIVQKNCQECHRSGQIGPMPLLDYDDVSAWAGTIREVVRARRMPPWYADPKHGKFENDRSLSAEDRDTLLTWIDQDCPKGDDNDLPPNPHFSEGWRIGKPDAVVTMPDPIKIPAKAPPGGIRYRYVLVPTDFPEDRWIQAVEAKPGSRAVVHHILVYVREAGKLQVDRADGIGDGLLVAHAPGDLPSRFPPGMAKKLPKGGFIVFQMHYTPNGVEQTDQSSVGLIFAKAPPKHEVHTRAVAQSRFVIPAAAENHQVVSTSTMRQDAVLLSLFPHMHLRGKSFEYKVSYPDGKSEILLSVPRYNFDWQNNYRLAQPLPLPKGTKIECTAYYDNSTNNPNNPDPTKAVRWGEQTWEEMMIGFMDYYYVEAEKEK